MQIEPDTCQMSSDLEALCFNYATGFLPQYKKMSILIWNFWLVSQKYYCHLLCEQVSLSWFFSHHFFCPQTHWDSLIQVTFRQISNKHLNNTGFTEKQYCVTKKTKEKRNLGTSEEAASHLKNVLGIGFFDSGKCTTIPCSPQEPCHHRSLWACHNVGARISGAWARKSWRW